MKTRRLISSGVLAAAVLVLVAGLATAQAPQGAPLGTGFTYQGQLKSDNIPYTGPCDVKFGLYDALTGGTELGVLTKTGVTVTKGLFTVQLDYGSGKFAGDARWLELSVRCPAGSGAYTLLSPRQALTAAPYALHATDAHLLDGSHASAFAPASHNHWRASWSGSGTGLTLSGGTTGLVGSGAAYGVSGEATAVSGNTYGVYGQSASTEGRGVFGYASAASGATYGVLGKSDSTSGKGVIGHVPASSGSTLGVYGQSDSTDGAGMEGHATAATGNTRGVYGKSDSTDGKGVYGEATAASGLTRGVEGTSKSSAGTGVVGHATASSGQTHGVWGQSDSTSGKGVVGFATSNSGTTAGTVGMAVSGVSWGVAGWNVGNGAGIGAWSSMGDLIQAYDGNFSGGVLRFRVDQAGNVYYNGSLIHFSSVTSADGRQTGQVSLYGLAGAEAWFEDLGSASLAEGWAKVLIDPVFAQTVALTESYQVQLTATCQEPVLLFVSEKTAAHFTVQGVTLTGQPSSCGFDWRLTANRLGSEDLRLEAVVAPGPAAVEKESQQ